MWVPVVKIRIVTMGVTQWRMQVRV